MPSSRKTCEFDGCRIKLALSDFPCKCCKTYCSKHRVPEDHKCSFNYRESAKQELLKYMSSPVIAPMIEKI